MDDLLEEFIAETRETMELLSGQLLQWEKDPSDRALVDSVFRFVHTVKGSCGFLDLPRLLRLSHGAEDMLSSARDGNIVPSAALVSAVLAVIDRIAELTDALETGCAIFDDDEILINAMLAFVPGEEGAPPNTMGPIGFVPSTNLTDYDFDVADGMVGNPKSRSVRVSLTLLDKLMNGVSDMVLARNEVSRQLRNSSGSPELDHSFERLSQTVAEMRDTIGLMRMQPIERLFSSLPRLVRDIAQELDKSIDLELEGSQVEVDREMVEALRDPLTHILRNAADHGIESPEERRAVGKSSAGMIKIIARQSGNQIRIEISDDGRGINLEKLANRAVAAKLVTPSQWQAMSEKAQLATIFTPGFTTSHQVSAISGRGVGMDVVRTNLQSLGGTIKLENQPGIGLKIILRLPLTLSITAGISVRAGNQIFGISRSSVIEILSINNQHVVIEEIGQAQIACIRGIRMPYARIEDILGIECAAKPDDFGRTLVLIRPAVGTSFALDVAGVIDTEEFVVKPGAPMVMAAGLYAGACLPDNGKPMLLLDSSGIAAAMGVVAAEYLAATVPADDDSVDAESFAALLFITTDGRKSAIRLSAIDRIEEIDAAKISYAGGKFRVQADGELTDIYGVHTAACDGTVPTLKLTDGEMYKYLAVAQVLDIFTIKSDVAPSSTPEIYEGVVEFDGEIVELVNVFQYFESAGNFAVIRESRPLCFVECSEDSTWERNILGPLLSASGYRVSYDPHERGNAQILLGREARSEALQTDARMLILRDKSYPSGSAQSSIYRYDRIGLISAIEDRLAAGVVK